MLSNLRKARLLTVLMAVALVISLVIPAGLKTAVAAEPAKAINLTILATSDLHGNIYPYDYFTDKPANVGLAKIATLIKQIRAENPNTLLVDNGDTIQGTPLVYYHNKLDNAPIDPMMKIMNELGYDSMTVANHEFNFGFKVMDKARSEAKFPWLSANTYREDGSNYFTPYIVKEVGGVKVGILGFTTPGIPMWENPENIKGLRWADISEDAKKWVKILKEKETVDVILVTAHSGLGRDPKTLAALPEVIPGEDDVYNLAMENPEIDAIVAGHSHTDIPTLDVNGVLITQPKRWGERLSRIDITLEPTGDANKPWKVSSKKAQTITIDDNVKADQAVLDSAKYYHDQTVAFTNSVIGEATGDFPGGPNQRLQDSAIVDLVNEVQAFYGKAQLSQAAIFNDKATIKKGPITVRDIYSIYIYENYMYTIEVTGKQVREALEHSSKYFLPYSFGDPNGNPLIDPNARGYNYDMISGVEYKLDLRKPFGQRVVELKYQGKDVTDDQKFTLAINSYRYNGGGKYTMFSGAPIIAKFGTEIRDMMIEYVKAKKVIEPKVDNNWSVIPDYLTHPAKDSIDLLHRKGITSGYPDGTFRPNQSINRAEFTALIVNAFQAPNVKAGTKSFDDVPAWAADVVERAAAAGLVSGVGPRTFGATAPVTREQAAVIAVRAAFGVDAAANASILDKYSDGKNVSDWARGAVAYAIEQGIISAQPDGSLQPGKALTRAEAAEIIAKARFVPLTVLTTNDFHGNLISNQVDSKTKKPWGNSDIVAAYFEAAKAKNPLGTIIVDAGDAFQGTPTSNVLRGRSMVDIMNAIGYDAMTLGNHEFDWGREVLADRIKQAKFPFISANIYYKATGEPVDFVEPYTIIERKGVKIGIIGLTTPETAVTTLPANVQDLEFKDPGVVAARLVPLLKARGADVVIVLGHLSGAVAQDGSVTGPMADVIKAAGGIDALVGGHSHTTVAGKVNGVPVVQAYYAGRSIGQIDLLYDRVLGGVVESKAQVTNTYSDNVKPVAKITDIMNAAKAEVGPLFDEVIGKTETGWTRDYNNESGPGNLTADILRNASGADFAFQNPGGLRIDIAAGKDITVGDIYAFMPFDNYVTTVEMTGAQVKKVLEHGATLFKGMVQVSGLKFTYDPSLPAGQRVIEMTLPDGTPIDLDKTYLVATNDFMATGGDGFTMFKEGKNMVNTYVTVRDEILEYVKAETAAGRAINPAVEGRITKVGQ